MEEKKSSLINTCNLKDVKPIMMDLPYPPTEVRGKNQTYANLLSVDYCGAVSEMTAIAQYINHENRLSCERCPLTRTILGIAMSEMIHLQKLGELIYLLGGNIEFTAKQNNGMMKMWTPGYITICDTVGKVLATNVEGERAAINQYKMHMRMIQDDCVNAVLGRIIKDEEYHILLLQMLMKEL